MKSLLFVRRSSFLTINIICHFTMKTKKKGKKKLGTTALWNNSSIRHKFISVSSLVTCICEEVMYYRHCMHIQYHRTGNFSYRVWGSLMRPEWSKIASLAPKISTYQLFAFLWVCSQLSRVFPFGIYPWGLATINPFLLFSQSPKTGHMWICEYYFNSAEKTNLTHLLETVNQSDHLM